MICLVLEGAVPVDVVGQLVDDIEHVYGEFFRGQPGFVFGTFGYRREEGRALGVWYFDTREHLLAASGAIAGMAAGLSASLGISVASLEFDVLASQVGSGGIRLFGEEASRDDEVIAPGSSSTAPRTGETEMASTDAPELFSRDLEGFRRVAGALAARAYVKAPGGALEWVRSATAERDSPASNVGATDATVQVHPDDLETVSAAFERAGEVGEPFESEFRVRQDDGSYRWIASRARPIRDTYGRVVQWVGTVADIDEHRHALTVFETMFSGAPVALGFVDRDYRFVHSNEAGARLQGLDVAQLIGKRLPDLMSEAWPEIEPIYRRVLDNGESIVDLEFEAEQPAWPGEQRHWLLSFFPVRVHGDVIGVGTVAIDVTEGKRAELQAKRLAEQRRRVLGELIRAQETERRRIAADIHGDTLQVLAAARLRLEQLGDTLHGTEQQAALGELDSALAAAQRRLRNMLFELWPPSLEQTGLRAAVDELLTRLELESNITARLESNLAQEPPVALRSIVFRVVAEALSNVRRHASATSTKVVLAQDDGELTVRVIDDGIGFDPATAPGPGHIGLLEMRERVETIGGRISITSAPGRGACVELTFSTAPWPPAA